MSKEGKPITNSVSRRSLLRKGAVTGALVVGGTAVSGKVAAEDHCNIRISGDGDGDGRQVTVSDIRNCRDDVLEGLAFEVREEIETGPGLCPEPQGNPQVRHYRVWIPNLERTASVRGSLPEGSEWVITTGSRC